MAQPYLYVTNVQTNISDVLRFCVSQVEYYAKCYGV